MCSPFFFALYLSELGVGQVHFFLLDILGQIRGVTADGEKRVKLVDKFQHLKFKI